MAKTDGIFLEWSGLSELADYFGGLEEAYLEAIVEEMTIYTLLVETGARAVTHLYSGDLEESITAKPIIVKSGEVIGEVGTNLVYALWIHEKPYGRKINDLYDNGYHEKDYYVYGRGRRTREKAYWRGLMPGRKYLTRVVNVTAPDFYAGMERAQRKATGGAL